MSMNLHASVGGEELFLMQTPSYVTDMCVVDSEGTLRNDLTGKEAKRALHIYVQWVQSQYQGPYKSQEEADDDYQDYKEHLSSILAPLSMGKKVKVWWC